MNGATILTPSVLLSVSKDERSLASAYATAELDAIVLIMPEEKRGPLRDRVLQPQGLLRTRSPF